MGEREERTATPKVVVRKIIKASRERIFEAWINPEIMARWFVGAKGVAKVTCDVQVGGNYTNEMVFEESWSSQTKDSTSKSFQHYGTYLEVVPPERLVFTWNSPAVQNTRVTVELKERDAGTEVTITHELFASEEELGSHTEGWTYAIESLTGVVEKLP